MPSGYVMYYQVNIQQVYILPTEYIYVFFMDLKNRATFTLYDFNCLVFRTKTEDVQCAVWTGSLNKTNYVLSVTD
jgi:hypothetical protein